MWPITIAACWHSAANWHLAQTHYSFILIGRKRKEIHSLVARHEARMPSPRVASALSLLHGHRPLFSAISSSPRLMGSGLPTNLPVGAVDMDQSATSRNLIRNLDAFGQTAVVARYGYVSRCPHCRARGQDITVSFISRRVVGRCPSQRQPKDFILHQQLLSHCGLFALQRHEDDE